MKTPYRRAGRGARMKTPRLKPASLTKTRAPGVDYAMESIRKGSRSKFGIDISDTMIRNGVKTPKINLPIDEVTKKLTKQKKFLAEKMAQYSPKTIEHQLQLVAAGVGTKTGVRQKPPGENEFEEVEPMTQRDAMIMGEGYAYEKRIKWCSSYISKEMQQNMKMYKASRYTFVDSENPQSTLWNKADGTGKFKAIFLNTMYSQSGYNRWSYINTLSYYIPATPGPLPLLVGQGQLCTPQNPFIMRGFLSTSLQRMSFIQRHLISASALETFFIDPERSIYKGKEGGERDFLFGIRSQTTTIDFYSRNPDFGVEFTIYSCIYKESTDLGPQDLLSSWNPVPNMADQNVNTTPDVYVVKPPTQPTGSLVANFPDLQDPLNNMQGYPECSVVPGCTPFFSPRFRSYADVENVHKFMLEPNDKATFHFTEEFSQPHSLREMKALHKPQYVNVDPTAPGGVNPDNFNYAGDAFQAGDRFLLIEHHGDKGTVEYINVDGGVPQLWNCSNTPSRVSFQWRNSFEYYAPNEVDPDISAYFQEGVDIPFRGTASIQSTARELNYDKDSLQSFDFADTKMKPVAASNTEYNPRRTKLD